MADRSSTTTIRAAAADSTRASRATHRSSSRPIRGKELGLPRHGSEFPLDQGLRVENLLVPVVGDFAGPKAIRAVGQWVKDRNAVVSVFYTSNVEQYLFMQGLDWDRYYKNVATLPLDASSAFIRSVGGGRGISMPPRAMVQQTMLGGRMRAPSVTGSIQELLKAYADGKIAIYGDVIALSR